MFLTNNDIFQDRMDENSHLNDSNSHFSTSLLIFTTFFFKLCLLVWKFGWDTFALKAFAPSALLFQNVRPLTTYWLNGSTQLSPTCSARKAFCSNDFLDKWDLKPSYKHDQVFQLKTFSLNSINFSFHNSISRCSMQLQGNCTLPDVYWKFWPAIFRSPIKVNFHFANMHKEAAHIRLSVCPSAKWTRF